MTKNVVGTYNTEEAVITAIRNLKTQGYPDSALSVLTNSAQHSENTEAIEHSAGIDVQTVDTDQNSKHHQSFMDKIKNAFTPSEEKMDQDVNRIENQLTEYGVPAAEASSYVSDLKNGKVLLMVDAVEHDKHNSALGQTVTPAEKSADPMNEKMLYGNHENKVK
ncbi:MULTISPECIES: general stress protein [Priestia]|uniref:general stress protein n=1 Tax=Priestia TaxID=2800373 RepID=UPI001C8D3423|nr:MULTISPECIES: general stress protein [Priestia]MBY0064015.1 general stress protein [Priestia aryabhattai]MDN3360626.1 general stress protein [Priestia megaterium]WKU23361.1 general stress protein [Priestia megaterium]